jgi:hypothetical protein
MQAYLRDDIEYLEKISASTALGMMTGVIKSRKELVRFMTDFRKQLQNTKN